MSYTLRRTDGQIVVTLPDNSIDTATLPLALVGRGAINYGTDFAQNFIQLLENFSHVRAPSSPLRGQIWFDKGQSRMMYYNDAWLPFDGNASSKGNPNAVVKRDANGNFEAALITANLHGNADTATKLLTGRKIILTGDANANVVFDGSQDVTLALEVTHADKADQWLTPRKLTLVGNVIGEAFMDGSGDVVINTRMDTTQKATVNIAGNADTSTRWGRPITLFLQGDATGSIAFDGATQVVRLPVSLSRTGVGAGWYNNVRVDPTGRVVDASNAPPPKAAAADLATRATTAGRADVATTADTATRATTAASADKLTSPRTITLAGGVSGTATFDGSGDLTISTTVTTQASGTITNAQNVGTGIGLFKEASGSLLSFRDIKAGTNITLNVVGDDVVISAAGSTGTGGGTGGGTDPTVKVNNAVHSDTADVATRAEYADGAGTAMYCDTARALDPNLRIDTILIKPLAVHQVYYAYQSVTPGKDDIRKTVRTDRPGTIQILPNDYAGWELLVDLAFDSQENHIRLVNWEVIADQGGQNTGIQSFYKLTQINAAGVQAVIQSTVGLYPFATSDGQFRRYITDPTSLGNGTARYQIHVCSTADAQFAGTQVRWYGCSIQSLSMKR